MIRKGDKYSYLGGGTGYVALADEVDGWVEVALANEPTSSIGKRRVDPDVFVWYEPNPAIRKGDHYSFVEGTGSGHYVATEDQNSQIVVGVHHLTSGGIIEQPLKSDLRFGDIKWITRAEDIEDNNKENDTVNTNHNAANVAKAELAAEYGLRAKFDYDKNDGMGAEPRRVEIENVSYNQETFGGTAYGQDGEEEGYKQFRFDRVVGPMVIR